MPDETDYSAIYEAACERFSGPPLYDDVTDMTYREYPVQPGWHPIEAGVRKFEVDVSGTKWTEDDVVQVLNDHGYVVHRKGDDRFADGVCSYKILAIVAEDSEPVPHEVDD